MALTLLKKRHTHRRGGDEKAECLGSECVMD